MRTLAAAMALVLVVSACGGGSDTVDLEALREEVASLKATTTVAPTTTVASPVYEIRGIFTLMDADIGGSTSNCRGTGGYKDIKSGLSVTVRDGSGDVVATGRLGDGKRTPTWCRFEFSVGGLPEVDFYSVEVGRRGELTYSFKEMEDINWEVTFKLGSYA